MELDMLERCRAGDTSAYRALVAFWGDRLLSMALALTHDPAGAQRLVRHVLIDAWPELPATHSEHPFRPWLLGRVIETARRRVEVSDEQAVWILQSIESMSPREITLALGWGVRGARKRVRSLARAGVEATRVEAGLPSRFFDAAILPALRDKPAVVARRMIGADARAAWMVLSDPMTVASWVGATDVRPLGARMQPGTRVLARGRVADRAPSRDESLVTRVEGPSPSGALLAWTTSSRMRQGPGGRVEFRWRVRLCDRDGACELVHELYGPSFPGGIGGARGRAVYARIAESMPVSMHRGMERFAALVEARARR